MLYRAELSREMDWSPRPGLNGHALRRRLLRPVRLPNSATRGKNYWCLMQDSNLHAVWPRLLRPLRLPFPPIRRVSWGAWSGSNRRPPDPHSGALPLRHKHHQTGRDGRIRTCGPVHPMHVRYQTALHPEIGLRDRARTDDPVSPRHVRCQLRYAEKSGRRGRVQTCDLVFPKDARCQAAPHADEVVVAIGIEPTTSALSRRCSAD